MLALWEEFVLGLRGLYQRSTGGIGGVVSRLRGNIRAANEATGFDLGTQVKINEPARSRLTRSAGARRRMIVGVSTAWVSRGLGDTTIAALDQIDFKAARTAECLC